MPESYLLTVIFILDGSVGSDKGAVDMCPESECDPT